MSKRAVCLLGARLVDRLRRLSGHGSADCVVFLLLHGVHDEGMERVAAAPTSSMSLRAFETSVEIIRRTHRVVSIDTAVDILTGRVSSPGRCAVITFDDSLNCLGSLAAPLLASRGLTATFYVSTGVVDTRTTYWWHRLHYALTRRPGQGVAVSLPGGTRLTLTTGQWDVALTELKSALRRLRPDDQEAIVTSIESQTGGALDGTAAAYPYAEILSWDDVRKLRNLGMTVGSHSVTHPNLSGLSAEQLADELAKSKERIESECGMPCRHLAYPYGIASPEVRRAARNLGYVSAVNGEGGRWRGHDSDVYSIGRIAVPAEPLRLVYGLSGLQAWVQRVRNLHCGVRRSRGRVAVRSREA